MPGSQDRRRDRQPAGSPPTGDATVSPLVVVPGRIVDIVTQPDP